MIFFHTHAGGEEEIPGEICFFLRWISYIKSLLLFYTFFFGLFAAVFLLYLLGGVDGGAIEAMKRRFICIFYFIFLFAYFFLVTLCCIQL